MFKFFWIFADKLSFSFSTTVPGDPVGADSGVWRAIQLIRYLYVHYSELHSSWGSLGRIYLAGNFWVTILFLPWPDVGSRGWRTRSIRSGEGLSFGRLVWSMPMSYVRLLRCTWEYGFKLRCIFVLFTDLSVRQIRNKFLCSLPNIVKNELRDPSDGTQKEKPCH